MSYAIIDFKPKKYLFNSIDIDEVCDELKIVVPKFEEKKSDKYAKKLSRILKKYRTSNVVLNNELTNYRVFKNRLNEENNYIITGNRMYKVLLPSLIRETSKIMGIEQEKLNITFLIDEYSIGNLELIKYIADKVKHVTIITNNAYRFEKLVDELMHYSGITIKLINKGKHNLKREHYVINVDFSSEDFNKINVPINSVVVSLNGEKYTIRKNFDGICINDIDIYLKNEIGNFRTLSLCEAYVYNYLKGIKENELIFNRSKYAINGYIGNNGVICQEDFSRLGKILDESKIKSS